MRAQGAQLTYTMRPMTREDFRGPTPIPLTQQELAQIQWQAAEEERRRKAGELRQKTVRSGEKSVVACMCCVAGFELVWICVVIIFMVDHDRFCNQYWENTDADGEFVIGGDTYWPNLNGEPKTYLWAWVYLITLGVNVIVNLAALTSHVICSRSLDNTCHAFMQYIVMFFHFVSGAFGLAWSIVGAIWVFGDKVIPWECKDGDLGDNGYYIFLAVVVIMGLVCWPFWCITLAIKSRAWWHDPEEGEKLMAEHHNRPPKPAAVDPHADFEKYGYVA